MANSIMKSEGYQIKNSDSEIISIALEDAMQNHSDGLEGTS